MELVPGVSFIIPVHEESVFLNECVSSIISQVDLKSIQIIIVKNNYHEDLLLLPELSERVEIVEEPMQGASYARNAGTLKAQYDYIAFIDCDIILKEDWCISNLKLLTLSQDVACVQAKIIPRFKQKSYLELYRYVSIRNITRGAFNYLSYPNTVPSLNSAAILCRKSCIEQIGGFNIELQRLEDTDLTFKLFSHGFILAVNSTTRAWVFNNHRNYFKYFKRSFHLGRYSFRLKQS